MVDGTYTRLFVKWNPPTVRIPDRLFTDYPACHARRPDKATEANMLDGLHRILATFFDPGLILQAMRRFSPSACPTPCCSRCSPARSASRSGC